MRRLVAALLALLLVAGAPARAELPAGQVWLDHVQRDLLPWWRHPGAQGQPVGRFPTFRCNDGAPYDAGKPCAELRNAPDWIRAELGREYVRMQARQVYAYAIGFHLSGDVALLRLAQAGVQDLRARARDPDSGSFASWFEAGRPQPALGRRTAQDLAYAGLALAALYYVTHDEALLEDLVRLKDHVFTRYRDERSGLIRWVAEDDGSGEAKRDELVATLDQLNAYLILVTPALPEGALKTAWRRDIATLSAALVERYHDAAGSRFVGTRGRPDSERPRGRHNDFGHTVKAYWMIYLGARQNGDAPLERFAAEGMRRTLDAAWLARSGSWASRVLGRNELDEGKEWWIYAELDQALATLALEQGDDPARLERSWRFWLERLTDRRRGEVWGWVAPDGSVPPDALKQHHWKNGYHSLEHALVGYLAAQGLRGEPATLHYAVPAQTDPARLRPYVFGGTIAGSSTREVEGVTVQAVRFTLARSGAPR